MERYTVCVLFLLQISGDTRAQIFQTTLYPEPPTLEVCPGENYTLSCTESGNAYIVWYWNDFIMRQYIAGLDYNINTTDLLLSDDNMMVSTRLISINSSHVHSQLEFTLFENVTSVNVSCNQVMLHIQNRECSIIRQNFRISGLHLLLNSSILTFEWEVFPACFISAVISNNNFSRDIDNGRPLELESSPNEHHNIDLVFPCSDDLLARIDITAVTQTTRIMTINIAKMHLAEGENIHVISTQQNSDTQYYEWIWPKKNSDVYYFEKNTTTGAFLNTDQDLCANNNNYQLIILPVVFCFSLILFVLSVILFTMTFVMIKNRNKRAKERSNNLTKCETTPQHPTTPTYEEVKVDHHSEATKMTANSAYGVQHTPHF